jgi:hypothetical protein
MREADLVGSLPTAIVCSESGVLLLTLANHPGIWFLHPRQIGRKMRRIPLSLPPDDWTILAADDAAPNVFLQHNCLVRQVVLPPYAWSGSPDIDADGAPAADHPGLQSFFSAAAC